MWILIVIVSGWTPQMGVATEGNSVAMVEFTTRERCQLAANMVKAVAHGRAADVGTAAFCVEK